MQRISLTALAATLLAASVSASPAGATSTRNIVTAATPPDAVAPAPAPVRYASAARGHMGGGLFEALFGGDEQPRSSGPLYRPDYYRDQAGYPRYEIDPRSGERMMHARGEPAYGTDVERRVSDPRYNRQVVEYEGKEPAGTVIVDTPNKFLYLVQEDGKALRYGIGVGRPGFTWAGVKTVSAKKEWPDWRPPDEMIKRRPDLPRYMPGGPENPLGARALYLGSSLYRIHGSNEPWTIGTAVSSGCIRMRNEDVIDLYSRVQVGARVIVI
ncbi:MAG TPA: L,D-transpeptidase [Xanthobacteraceae bacterium]